MTVTFPSQGRVGSYQVTVLRSYQVTVDKSVYPNGLCTWRYQVTVAWGDQVTVVFGRGSRYLLGGRRGLPPDM